MKQSLYLFIIALALCACRTDDISAPAITLRGNDPTFVRLGAPYVEAGADAIDVEEGAIGDIDIDASDIQVDTVGTYNVQYLAFDQSDNLGTQSRTVHVFADAAVYSGTYSTEAVCAEDTVNYTVTVSADAADSTLLLIDNLAELGAGTAVIVRLSGNTFSSLTAADTVGGDPIGGNGTLTDGSTGLFRFTLNYSLQGASDTLSCNGTFTKQ